MVMNRVYRGPFGALLEEVGTVQGEVARLFNRVAPYVAASAGPQLNIREDDQAIYVEVDLPGVDPAKIDVTVTEGNQLAVRAERSIPEVPGATWVRQERPSGEFHREIGLPALVNADAVQASYDAGVLKLNLPKHEAVKPRKIEVKLG
jgi:HSP20 family protein